MCVSFVVPRSTDGDFEGIWVPWVHSGLICEGANEACKGIADPDNTVITIGLHEEGARELQSCDDGEVFDRVAQDWQRLFPRFSDAMRPLHVQRWCHAMPVYAPGVITAVRSFWNNGQGHGNVFFCGDFLNHPWAEGA